MEVLKHAVNILHNLSVYQDTARALFRAENAIGVFVDLLQNYRDTDHIYLTV